MAVTTSSLMRSHPHQAIRRPGAVASDGPRVQRTAHRVAEGSLSYPVQARLVFTRPTWASSGADLRGDWQMAEGRSAEVKEALAGTPSARSRACRPTGSRSSLTVTRISPCPSSAIDEAASLTLVARPSCARGAVRPGPPVGYTRTHIHGRIPGRRGPDAAVPVPGLERRPRPLPGRGRRLATARHARHGTGPAHAVLRRAGHVRRQRGQRPALRAGDPLAARPYRRCRSGARRRREQE
jgi:hypothetical protein